MNKTSVALLSVAAGWIAHRAIAAGESKPHRTILPPAMLDSQLPLCNLFYIAMELRLESGNKKLPIHVRRSLIQESIALDKIRIELNAIQV